MTTQKKIPANLDHQGGGDIETTTELKLGFSVSNVNDTVGDSMLCAWLVARGACWVQTRSPEFAKLLAKRKDGKLVSRSIAGGYLRIFEFPHPLSWATALIDRYTGRDRTANWRVSVLKGDLTRFDSEKVSGHHPESPARPAAF